MPYDFQFNLQQKATLSVAISLLKKNEVKRKIRQLANLDGRLTKAGVERKWRQIINLVKELNQHVLPPTLENELMYFVRKLGEKLYNWYVLIEIENQFPFKIEEVKDYLDEIYWTPYGTIDEVKIFESYLSNNPNRFPKIMYCIACYYALEEHIDDLWEQMSEDSKKQCDEDIFTNVDRHIWVYWRHWRDGNLPLLKFYFDTFYMLKEPLTYEYDFSYRIDHSPEENMLWMSVHEGDHIAAKYFWGKINERERNACIIDCTRMAMMCYDDYEIENKKIKNHKKERYAEICLFLINQMNKDQKEFLFNQELSLENVDDFDIMNEDVKSKILVMLLFVWPWQELFIPVLNDMLPYVKTNSLTLSIMLFESSRKMSHEHKKGCNIKNTTYSSILQTVWSHLLVTTKRKMIYSGISGLVNELLAVQDLESINLIFNDPTIPDLRNQLIESGKRGYMRLISNNQYAFLNQFIERVLISDKEKDDFKKKVIEWKGIIEGEQLDVAEELHNLWPPENATSSK
ncbi:uncharacterized protein [Chelonus insularis]|uniref:uncharacterized protein n=1 Tax=Chelonus insularis TaxID=460826 RepID=UPI00158B54C5|nr:uncharacterized protein LOC118063888 [Chelonus insularis]